MGNGDLGVTGALEYQTPAIDKMASEGVRFTNFLSAQGVCSASRAGLLTGCYPNRIGISGALFPNSNVGIHPEETTMAELFKQKGYATAIVGKWHLGDAKEFLPLQHGFDEYFGIPFSNDMWPVDYNGNPATDWRKERFPPLFIVEGNEKKIPVNTLDDQAQLTKRYTERAIDFIHRQKKKPFFLYLPHSMPHVPINASAQFKGKSKQGLYGDVMMEIDWSVGEILKALKATGIEKNTMIIFTSDNGAALYSRTVTNEPLTGGKFTFYEGGINVPLIFYYPNKIKPLTNLNQPVMLFDLYATIADVAQIPIAKDRTIDGVSLMPWLVKDNKKLIHFKLCWYSEYNRAIRLSDWKLIVNTWDKTIELYDLYNHLPEDMEVSAEKPTIVKLLIKELDDWIKELPPALWPRLVDYQLMVNGKVTRWGV